MTCPRWIVPIVVLAVLLTACSGGGGEAACTERIAGVRPGLCLRDADQRPAAPTTRFAVLGEDGELGVPDFAGDVLVVNFWGSWCGPCRREQPALNEAFETLSPLGVSFLGVDVQDSETNGKAHESEFAIPYPSLFDPASSYAAQFAGVGPRSIPSTVLIDRQGRIAATIFGETTAEEVVILTRMLASENA
jgi:thiol-disulfide isomerase/thioredoxin